MTRAVEPLSVRMPEHLIKTYNFKAKYGKPETAKKGGSLMLSQIHVSGTVKMHILIIRLIMRDA